MASMAEMLDGQIGICAAANIRPSRDGSSFDVYPTHGDGPSFTAKTLHISCKSDTYHGSTVESLFTRVTVKQIGILQTELTARVDIL